MILHRCFFCRLCGMLPSPGRRAPPTIRGSGGLRALRVDGIAVRTRLASRPPPALGGVPGETAIEQLSYRARRSEPHKRSSSINVYSLSSPTQLQIIYTHSPKRNHLPNHNPYNLHIVRFTSRNDMQKISHNHIIKQMIPKPHPE